VHHPFHGILEIILQLFVGMTRELDWYILQTGRSSKLVVFVLQHKVVLVTVEVIVRSYRRFDVAAFALISPASEGRLADWRFLIFQLFLVIFRL
jgi:hypothetical protein